MFTIMNGLKPRIYFSNDKQNVAESRDECSALKSHSGFEGKIEVRAPDGWEESHCFYYLAFKRKHNIPI